MRHVTLVVQYDGTEFAGFQIQPDVPTVQGELQLALSRLLQQPTQLWGASRTDAGVHAMGQVVLFETESPLPVERLPHALNAILPRAVSVVSAIEAPEGFHPRYSAVGKLYSYRILNRRLPSPFIERYAWRIERPLVLDDMRDAGRDLIGEHDFAAFCAAGSSVHDTVRRVDRLDVHREGDLLEFFISGNGFLYKMVRIIVGTLVEVGLGRRRPGDVEGILLRRDRTQAGRTAPAQGLSLVKVEY